MCGQRTAEGWVMEIGRKHDFKFFAGLYPLFIWDAAHLEQAIHEIAILREERRQELDRIPSVSNADKAYELQSWDAILERLKRLRTEEGWQADFG